MTHDPESDAARYLGRQMSAPRRARYAEHLLGCDACWREVAAAQEGRRLAESARELAPAQLRERVRVLAESARPAGPQTSPGSRRRLPARVRPALAAAAAVVVAGGLVTALGAAGTPGRGGAPADPPALRTAVADFRAQELPGTEVPDAVAPDLSPLRLRPVGGGGGAYDGLPVDGYAYRDDAGRRVVLYLSDEPFPTAAGAQPVAGPDGPWTVRRGDVVVLCARAPHALLVVGQDPALVRSAAAALGVV